MKYTSGIIGCLLAIGYVIQASATTIPENTAKPEVNNTSKTYTYLRCWYREKNDKNSQQANYVWASHADNQWYKISGNWHTSSVLSWKNMFFTDVDQKTLRDACQKTLAAKNITSPLVDIYAADNGASLNYAIWNNDGATQNAVSLNRIISFGDSMSDNQNMFNATQWQAPNRKSWFFGRFSNGPVWVEYLAATTHLPLYNWAVAGAASDEYTVAYGVKLPGLKQQVLSWRQYMQSAKNYQINKTLFTVLVGGNDFVFYRRTPEQVINSVSEALQTLIDSGASNILVLNLPDASRAPIFKVRTSGPIVAGNIKDYNHRLSELVSQIQTKYPEIKIKLFDSYKMYGQLLDNPGLGGVSNTTDSCLAIDNVSTLNFFYSIPLRKECHDPKQFVFWDNVHPSTKVHKLLANYVYRDIVANTWPLPDAAGSH